MLIISPAGVGAGIDGNVFGQRRVLVFQGGLTSKLSSGMSTAPRERAIGETVADFPPVTDRGRLAACDTQQRPQTGTHWLFQLCVCELAYLRNYVPSPWHRILRHLHPCLTCAQNYSNCILQDAQIAANATFCHDHSPMELPPCSTAPIIQLPQDTRVPCVMPFFKEML